MAASAAIGMHAISPWTTPLDNQAPQVRGPPRPSMPRSLERQRGAKRIAVASRKKSISLDMQSKRAGGLCNRKRNGPKQKGMKRN